MKVFFPVKYFLKNLIIFFVFAAINVTIFWIHLKTKSKPLTTGRIPRHADFAHEFRLQQASMARYFEHKSKSRSQSPNKVILKNVYQATRNKTFFLIYEYTRHRLFCRYKNEKSIYVPTCPFINCRFTCDPSQIQTADAVLMLYSQLKYDRVLNFSSLRNSNQRWLLWHDEPYPPSSVYNKFLFNWTMTYRSDSEVSVGAYGVSFLRTNPMNKDKFNEWVEVNHNMRRNDALWFVGNCSPKRRLQYYEELRKYFSIRAYGRCLQGMRNDSAACKRRSACERQQLFSSKFYLAFESTTTRIDYITEKFWRSLAHGLIPVVLGPKRRDYERVAPPNSFIYAADYSNPQELGKHLTEVISNQNTYAQYHQWRINYEIRYLGKDVESFRFCELCYALNTNTDRIWYKNLNKFFVEAD